MLRVFSVPYNIAPLHPIIQKPTKTRRNEPNVCAIVYCKSLTSFEYFSNQSDVYQRPLNNPTARHIFIIKDTVPTSIVSGVLQKTFAKYHILYAMLVVKGDGDEDEAHQIGYHNPFEKIASSDGQTPMHGAIKWNDDEQGSSFWSNNCTLNLNFNGYPFRTAMFRRFPTLISSTELSQHFLKSYYGSVSGYAANFSGFDGIVLGNLAKHLNFQVIPMLSNHDKYGAKLANGTFTGIPN